MTYRETQEALQELDALRRRLVTLGQTDPRGHGGELGADIRRLAADLRRISADIGTGLVPPAPKP